MTRARWGALAGAVMLGAVPVPTTATAAPMPQAAKVRNYSSQMSLASYNIRHALSPATATRDVERLVSAGADVIGLQEMGSRKRRNAVMSAVRDCRSCVMDGAFFDSPAALGAVPILYRKDRFSLYDSGSQMLFPRTYIGPRGAGPSTSPAKYVTWVKLQEHRTGRFFYVLNSHALPSVQGSGGGANSNRTRISLYKKHMEGLKALVTQFKRHQVGVFVLGDLNVHYARDRVVQDRAFPFKNMADVRVKASYERLGIPDSGTHLRSDGTSRRLIDYVYFLGRAVFRPKNQSILDGYSSDHRPLVVSFRAVGPGAARVKEPMPRG